MYTIGVGVINTTVSVGVPTPTSEDSVGSETTVEETAGNSDNIVGTVSAVLGRTELTTYIAAADV